MTFTKQPQETTGTTIHGNVSYLDGSALLRPQRPTKTVVGIGAIIVIIALLLSGSVASKAIDKILHGEENRAAQIETLLQRDVSLNLPVLTDLFYQDDATLIQGLIDSGRQIIDLDAMAAQAQDIEYIDNPGVDIVCAPSDVDLNKAIAVYAKGINQVDAISFATYYNTSWHLVNDIDNAVMSVKYTDFAATTPDEALDNAMTSQGWLDNEYVTIDEEGIDGAGNNFRSGTVYADAGDFTFRISTCLLSAAYDIRDLPETAHYVGIKVYPL